MQRWCPWCRPALLWPLLALLAFVGTVGACSSVEADVEARTRVALDQAGLDDVAVADVRYRDVDLSGPESARDSALLAVTELEASRTVSYLGGVVERPESEATPSPDGVEVDAPAIEMTGSLMDGFLTLSGVVPDEATRSALVDAATAAFGSEQVEDQLSVSGVDATAEQTGATGALTAMFPEMAANLAAADFSLKGIDLDLTGLPLSIDAKSAFGRVAGTLSPAFGDAAITLEDVEEEASPSDAGAVDPQVDLPHIDMTGTLSGDTITLRGSVPDQASKDSLVAAAHEAFGVSNVVDEITVVGIETSQELSDVVGGLSGLFTTLRQGLTEASFSLGDADLDLSGVAFDLDSLAALRSALDGSGFSVKGAIDDTAAKGAAAGQVESDIAAVLALQSITFENDSAVITAAGQAVINEVAALLGPAIAAQPGLGISVSGHTDSIGDSTYNQDLSERRAQAVVDRLVELDIAAANLTGAGFGETDPVASNATSEGRAQNRRIDFAIEEG